MTFRLQIALKHQAPVIGLAVIDATYYPLPPALEVQNGRAKAPDMNSNHRLLVISEEQFKVKYGWLICCSSESSVNLACVNYIIAF